MQDRLEFGAREWGMAYRVALRVLRAPDRAEDAAQDALLRAFLARAQFLGDAEPESWLYRIAFNTAISHLRRPFHRRLSRRPVERALEEATSFERPAPDPEQAAVASELARKLDLCLRTLHPLDQIAFTERFLLGTSEKELGCLLGVSTNAAKQRAFRARRRVMSWMRQARAA